MGRDSGAAGLAALAICEAILLSLTRNRVIDVAEARAILADAAAAHRGATPSTAPHEEAAAIIEAMLAGDASARRARPGAAVTGARPGFPPAAGGRPGGRAHRHPFEPRPATAARTGGCDHPGLQARTAGLKKA